MTTFSPDAKKVYTLEQLLQNGMEHMRQENAAPDGAYEVSVATVKALLNLYGADTKVPGAVNDLVGRSLVHMVGAIGTINRVVELMKVHNGELMKVYYQLEQEGLLLASRALYDETK